VNKEQLQSGGAEGKGRQPQAKAPASAGEHKLKTENRYPVHRWRHGPWTVRFKVVASVSLQASRSCRTCTPTTAVAPG